MQIMKYYSGQRTKKASFWFLLFIATGLLLIAGCAAQGAKRVPADRFDYNAAIALSTREQMLLNIVRSRYLELPVFLTVSSVLTQYEYDRSIGVGAILEFGTETTDRGTGEANSNKVSENLRPLLGELRQLIGLTNGNRFRITDRVTNLKSDELSIQTRSVMAMMDFMARGVEVPLEHLQEGRVIDYDLQSSGGEVAQGLIPFKMRSSKSRPQNVFAAVRFNDYWYYIDHNDITSKRALSLIIVLFRLQAPTPAGAAPILSLPTG